MGPIGVYYMLLGKYVTICGNITIKASASNMSIKNGSAARATTKMLRPVRDCKTNKLNPTGGVICDISTTMTMKIPNQSGSIPTALTIGMMTEVVKTTTEMPSKKHPKITKNTVNAAKSA